MTAVLDPTTSHQAPPPPPRRRGRAWLVIGLVLAILAVGDGAGNVVGLLSHQHVHYHHQWAGPVTSVDIHLGDGSLTLIGADQTGVTVDASGSRGLVAPSDHESLAGGRLTIGSGCRAVIVQSWCSLSYRLVVPRQATIVARNGDGSTHISGVHSSLDVSAGDGSIHVDGPTGTLQLSDGDGSVTVTAATSPNATVSSGDGSVHLGFAAAPQTLQLRSGDGSVRVELPDTAVAYHVNAHSGEGTVTTDIRTDPDSSHRIDADTGDGSITLRYASG